MSLLTKFTTPISSLFSSKALLALPLCAAFAFAATTSQTKADPLTSGVIGAIGGAAIGGATGGKKGAARGAAIGLGAGVVLGAIAEEEKRKRRAKRRYKKRKYHAKKHYVRRTAPPRYVPGPPPPAYDQGLVYETQLELQRLGYNPGPVDGIYGRQTADALATYQDDYALPITGEPTPDLLYHMRKHDG